MSSEEQACLVRTRSDSEGSGRILSGFGSIGRGKGAMAYAERTTVGGENGSANSPNTLILQERTRSSNDSGELIDYQDMNLFSQFHEDAIKQAGFGKHQLKSSLVFGLIFASSGIEYASVSNVIPSAEIEFCMTTDQKWWLTSITLLGIGFGAVAWGNLADRMGRRRTLISCLFVNAVFSVIAAFMPTLGPFMMARFCSALGAGGAPVAAASSFVEIIGGNGGRRVRCLALLLSAACLGALSATGLAALALPLSGRDTVVENKEHFSAWHRYLLLCSIPTIASLICLTWLDESPRYLLECGREVEAMMIYQQIYKKNRSKRNTANGVIGSGSNTGYQLSELELPSKRPHRQSPSAPPSTSVLGDMAYSVKQCCNCFLQLFMKPYAHSTYMIVGTVSVALFFSIAFTVYAPNMIVKTKNAIFQANTAIITNQTYENILFNTTIENIVYENSTFTNCTFKDITFSHVVFKYCNFFNVKFTSIMSSFTYFEGSYFQGTSFIDTDLNTDRHMDATCRLINSTVLGLSPACHIETDHNIYLKEGLKARAATYGAAFLAMLLSGLLYTFISRVHTIVSALALVSITSLGMYFISAEDPIIVFASLCSGLVAVAYVGLTIIILESYSVHLRCSAFGFFYSVGHFMGLLAAAIYANLTLHSYILATLLTFIIAVTGTIFASRLIDSSSNLI